MYVVTAYGVQCLVGGCRVSGAEQQAVSPGRGMLHDWPCQVVQGGKWLVGTEGSGRLRIVQE